MLPHVPQNRKASGLSAPQASQRTLIVASCRSRGAPTSLGGEFLDERGREPHLPRADLLRRAGRVAEAAAAYRTAVELSANPAERAYLESRWVELSGAPG